MGAFLFSLTIHGFLVYSFVYGSFGPQTPAGEPIQISYRLYEKPLIEEKVRPVPKIKKIEPLPTRKISISPPAPAKPRTAADFMTDPQKGKIFFSYFGKIKEKIHTNLRRKYRPEDTSLGVVSLFFILNPDGSLEKVEVLGKESDASLELQRVALEALKGSSPFESFPVDLGRGPLAFNLKVYFDELDQGAAV